jgi:hypothetical protein
MKPAQLQISDSRALPIEVATETTAILAKKGAGKTYTANVLAEELIAAKVQTLIIDPTSAWWGLRSSADGNAAGLPVTIFGGDHADVAITPAMGELVADYCMDERISAVIDLGRFRKGEQVAFFTAFAEWLYHKNRTAMHLVVDEADAYCPQRVGPEMARSVGALEDIVRRGRIRGIGVTLITQRPAVLNKNVLTQLDTLIVLQMTAPQDRKAILEWIDQNADAEQAKTIIQSLATLKKGEAWVWSPGLGILERLQIRKRRTFDSSSTPKVGARAVEPRVLADVEKSSLAERFAAAIETAKADDPKALRARIRELEHHLSETAARSLAERAAAAPPEPVRIEVPVLQKGEIERALQFAEQLRTAATEAFDAADAIQSVIQSVLDAQRGETAVAIAPPAKASSAPRPARTASAPRAASEALASGPRKILEALAGTREGRATRTQLGFLSGFSAGGGTFQKYASTLRTAGFITGDGSMLVITADGRGVAGAVPAVTTADVHGMWRAKLGGGPLKMLDALIAIWPKGVTRDELGEKTGYETAGGTFQKYLSTLSGLDIIEKRGATIVAIEALFPTGKSR